MKILLMVLLILWPMAAEADIYNGQISQAQLNQEFSQYLIARIFPCPQGLEHTHLFLYNPDETAKIRAVHITANQRETGEIVILTYAFAAEGKEYVFIYDPAQDLFFAPAEELKGIKRQNVKWIKEEI